MERLVSVFKKIFAVLIITVPLTTQGLSLYLKQSAVVRTETVRLRDLVDTSAMPAQVAARVELWESDLAVPADRLSLIPSAHVRKALAGFSDEEVVIVGKRVAVIPLSFFNEKNTWLYLKVLAWMDTVTAQDARIEIVWDSPAVAETLGETVGGYFKVLRGEKRYGLMSGRLELAYCIIHPDWRTEVTACKISLTVTQYIPVAVICRAVSRGQRVQSQDFLLQEINVSALTQDPLRDFSSLTQFKYKKGLKPPAVLSISDLEKAYDVKSGETVVIYFYSGGIEISVPGRALSSGAQGELVTVMPLNSANRFAAQVIGERRVAVVWD